MLYQPGDIVLSKYRVERFIGKGASAEVYLATHLELKTPRALKVLSRDLPGVGTTAFGDYRQRFQLEAQLGARIDHPNVIRVYDFHQDDDTLVLVMEYAAGGSLAGRIAKARESGQPIPVDEAVRIAGEVAQGLSALHALDCVHRDLKPYNILLDGQGRAKVADLGLAQIPGGPSQRSVLSQPLAHPGTPAYMSPEQRLSNDHLTPASDVYALGSVLFELLTGRLFRNVEPGTQMRALRADVPEWLDALVMRMVSDDPRQRPWDGAKMAGLLREGAQEAEAAEQARLAEEARPGEAERLAEQERQRREVAEQETRRLAAAQATEKAWHDRQAPEAARRDEDQRRSTTVTTAGDTGRHSLGERIAQREGAWPDREASGDGGRRVPWQTLGVAVAAMATLGLVLLSLSGAFSGAPAPVPTAVQRVPTASNTSRPAATSTRTPPETALATATSTPVPARPTVSLTPTIPTAAPKTLPSATPAGPLKRLDVAVSWTANGNVSRLNAIDLATGTATRIFDLDHGSGTQISSAVWSPDGMSVLATVWWSQGIGNYCGYALRRVNSDGSNMVDIATGPLSDYSRNACDLDTSPQNAIWSPDGRRIAVRRVQGSDYGVFTVNSDGTGLQRLRSTDLSDRPRYWSVDGHWIVALSPTDWTLYALEVDGTKRVPLAQLSGMAMYDQRYYPWRVTDRPKCEPKNRWSPDSFWDCE